MTWQVTHYPTFNYQSITLNLIILPHGSLQGGAGGRGLGLVDLGLGHSTTCLVVPGQMGVWLNRLCSWATWWNIQIKANPTQVHNHQPNPV